MHRFSVSLSNERDKLPDDVRQAFLDILFYTLLYVRSRANEQSLCIALLDHARNIPDYIAKPKPERLRYYWEFERPPFLWRMQELREMVSVFEPSWKIIEQEYERLKTPAVVYGRSLPSNARRSLPLRHSRLTSSARHSAGQGAQGGTR